MLIKGPWARVLWLRRPHRLPVSCCSRDDKLDTCRRVGYICVLWLPTCVRYGNGNSLRTGPWADGCG